MSVYAIGRLKLRNTDWLEAYQGPTRALIEKHGGRYVVAGGAPDHLEGEMTPPDAMVVLEFPSREAALAWHSDPDYQPLIELRKTGCDGELVIVDGAD